MDTKYRKFHRSFVPIHSSRQSSCQRQQIDLFDSDKEISITQSQVTAPFYPPANEDQLSCQYKFDPYTGLWTK